MSWCRLGWTNRRRRPLATLPQALARWPLAIDVLTFTNLLSSKPTERGYRQVGGSLGNPARADGRWKSFPPVREIVRAVYQGVKQQTESQELPRFRQRGSCQQGP